jgi:hypothetical protein
MISWIKQEDPAGCVPACLAMITGKTYREVADYLAPRVSTWGADAEGKYVETVGISFAEHGMDFCKAYYYLMEHGFAWQSIGEVQYNNRDKRIWPPEPWADLHLCDVRTSGFHAVVMLRDGTVLDPLTPEPKRLSDYGAVFNVTGLFKTERK